MDFLTVILLVLLAASLCALVLPTLEKRWTRMTDSDRRDWALCENCPPERSPAPIDPMMLKTLQGMNQLSQRRYSGLHRAERVSDELLRKVQEMTGEYR